MKAMNALDKLAIFIDDTYPALADPIHALNPRISRNHFLLEVMRIVGYTIPNKFCPRLKTSDPYILIQEANVDFIDDFKRYLDMRSKGLVSTAPIFAPGKSLLRPATQPPVPGSISSSPKLGMYLLKPKDPTTMRAFLESLDVERLPGQYNTTIPAHQVIVTINELSHEALEEFSDLPLLDLGNGRFVLPNGCKIQFIGEALKTLTEVINDIDIRKKIKAKQEAEFKAKHNSFTGDVAPEDWGTW